MMHSWVLVPQGAEYQAVARSLSKLPGDRPLTLAAIPVGRAAVTQWLAQQAIQHPDPIEHIILCGLCGSLRSTIPVGQAVTYTHCQDEAGQQWICEPIAHPAVIPVQGLSSDRLVHLAAEKQKLAQTYNVDVVEMEAAAVLTYAHSQGIPVSILRVVSDDAHYDLPDLTTAIDAAGNLQPMPLALEMIRHPIAALRLIRGSLQGLARLEQVTRQIF
ncbi:MAG: hypothetical protein VKJ24_04280 [Synechococcales bacterium]|nr:hypothetical protein [Synechococcales bacterium]